jgi:hypothetical protein
VVILAVCARPSLIAQPAATVSVPFVGCKSDGQTGPMDAPKGKAKSVSMSSEVAQQLAYYESAEGLGVLGPRGWDCFRTYTSSGGDALYVAPHPVDIAKLRLADSVIELSRRLGGTSGRFAVAEVIARVFPADRAFTRHVMKGDEVSFPVGPYPEDKLTYKGNRTVEYETPAQTSGLGTRSWLLKNDSPIDGVAMLIGKTPDLVLLSVRLPSGLSGLTPTIVGQLEHDAPRFNQ